MLRKAGLEPVSSRNNDKSGLGAGLRRRNFDGGEANQKARAGGNVIFDAKSAVMFCDDAAGDGEAEAGAAILGGEMREEEFVFVFWRDAVARVSNFDFDGIAIASETRRDGDGAECGAFEGFGGVVDQVDKHATNEFRVGFHDGKRGSEVAVDFDAVEASAKNVESLRGDGVDVRRSKARGREAGKLRKFVDERLERLHFALDEAGALGDERGQIGAIFAASRRGGAFKVAQEALGGELNRSERILDFVRDALSDFLPGGGLLGAEKFGDVIDDDDVARIGTAGTEGANGDCRVM